MRPEGKDDWPRIGSRTAYVLGAALDLFGLRRRRLRNGRVNADRNILNAQFVLPLSQRQHLQLCYVETLHCR